jgi:hypothetical protein
MWCLYLQTQRGSLLNFCGPKTGTPRRFDPATCLYLRDPPGKKRPPWHGAPPGAPPRDPWTSPDHPTCWQPPPGTHHGQGGENTAQFGPCLGAPTKSRSLAKLRPCCFLLWCMYLLGTMSFAHHLCGGRRGGRYGCQKNCVARPDRCISAQLFGTHSPSEPPCALYLQGFPPGGAIGLMWSLRGAYANQATRRRPARQKEFG